MTIKKLWLLVLPLLVSDFLLQGQNVYNFHCMDFTYQKKENDITKRITEIFEEELNMTEAFQLLQRENDIIKLIGRELKFQDENGVIRQEQNNLKKLGADFIIVGDISYSNSNLEITHLPLKVSFTNINTLEVMPLTIYIPAGKIRDEKYCQDLIRGEIEKFIASFFKDIPKVDDNEEIRIVRTTPMPAPENRYGLIVEFGISKGVCKGIYLGIDLGTTYDKVLAWFYKPNFPEIPNTTGGAFFNSSVREEPPIYVRRFSDPEITPRTSFYLYFESNEPFNIQGIRFDNYYGDTPK